MAVCHIDASGPQARGHANIAVVFQGPLGQLNSPIFVEDAGYISPPMAEWSALILALEKGRENGERQMHIYTDALVMARQVHGRYRVHEGQCRELYERAMFLIGQFELVTVQYIPRRQNREADFYSKRGEGP